jgi:hypothetical protein
LNPHFGGRSVFHSLGWQPCAQAPGRFSQRHPVVFRVGGVVVVFAEL